MSFAVVSVTSFNETLYPNGLRIYKELEDKSALVVPSTDMDTVVTFSIVAAREGRLRYGWELDNAQSDPRLIGASTRPFVAVRPEFRDGDTTPEIRVEVFLLFDDIVPQSFVVSLHLLGRPILQQTQEYMFTL